MMIQGDTMDLVIICVTILLICILRTMRPKR